MKLLVRGRLSEGKHDEHSEENCCALGEGNTVGRHVLPPIFREECRLYCGFTCPLLPYLSLPFGYSFYAKVYRGLGLACARECSHARSVGIVRNSNAPKPRSMQFNPGQVAPVHIRATVAVSNHEVAVNVSTQIDVTVCASFAESPASPSEGGRSPLVDVRFSIAKELKRGE